MSALAADVSVPGEDVPPPKEDAAPSAVASERTEPATKKLPNQKGKGIGKKAKANADSEDGDDDPENKTTKKPRVDNQNIHGNAGGKQTKKAPQTKYRKPAMKT